jgi:uncharacterized protein (TIGR02145 family)
VNYSVKIPVILILLTSLTGCLISCKKKPTSPFVTTAKVTDITETTATTAGNVTFDGNADITARGVCWGTSQDPTQDDNVLASGEGTGVFTCILTGLTQGTTYYVRAYATNSAGTSYGDLVSFKTLTKIITIDSIGPILFNPDITYETVSDIDGNIYKTVTIGTQTWMAENLKTTHLNDGTRAYPNWYEYNNVYKEIYGGYYTFKNIVETGKLCPSGWHIPTKDEFQVMIDYLGGEAIAGGKLKESGTTHWSSPNTGATNESGFTALPGGMLSWGGPFDPMNIKWAGLNYGGSFWATTTYQGFINLWAFVISYNSSMITNLGTYYGEEKMSVRCIKDK